MLTQLLPSPTNQGLDKNNMPKTGDVMILKSDLTLKPVKDFTAQIQTLDIPGEVKAGYSPIGFVRCGRSACKLKEIKWKVSHIGLYLNAWCDVHWSLRSAAVSVLSS
jgi:GTPase